MKTNIDIPSLTQACKHIYRYSQQIPQAWTHPFTSTLKYCYITYCKTWKSSQIHSHKCFCCCSVTQSCLTFCGPMDRSTPGFPVLFHLPEFAHSCPLSRWCHPTILSSVIPFSCLQSFPEAGSFPMSLFFTSCGQNIGASFSISPSNEYSRLISYRIDWFNLLTVQESSPTPQFKTINSLVLNLLYGPTLTSIHDYWKNHRFKYMDLCWQTNVSAF